MNDFDIPVVLFIFKRLKAIEIMKRIREVKPKKIYILADYGRNEEEIKLCEECRKKVEEIIDWDCQVIKNYATENRGVWGNIGLGAEWIFQREEKAIFLEDDNLPEVTFFQYCKEMLEKYEEDSRILWVCGTNYLGKYIPEDGSSYVFTRHMLPCGWASWSKKFLKYYDKELTLIEDKVVMKKIKREYYDKRIFTQYSRCWKWEKEKIDQGKRPISWDYHMNLALRANGLYGISPCYNQIKNIGVDTNATHGGDTFSDRLTKRICGMDSYPLEFPLRHPKVVLRDKEFEIKISRIMLYPLEQRVKFFLLRIIKKIFNIPQNVSTKEFFKKRMNIGGK